MEGMTSLYTAMILHGELPPPRALNNDDDDDDTGPIHEHRTLSSIELAHSAGLFLFQCNAFGTLLIHGLLLEQEYPHNVEDLVVYIDQPHFPHLLWRFLYKQLNDSSI